MDAKIEQCQVAEAALLKLQLYVVNAASVTSSTGDESADLDSEAQTAPTSSTLDEDLALPINVTLEAFQASPPLPTPASLLDQGTAADEAMTMLTAKLTSLHLVNTTELVLIDLVHFEVLDCSPNVQIRFQHAVSDASLPSAALFELLWQSCHDQDVLLTVYHRMQQGSIRCASAVYRAAGTWWQNDMMAVQQGADSCKVMQVCQPTTEPTSTQACAFLAGEVLYGAYGQTAKYPPMQLSSLALPPARDVCGAAQGALSAHCTTLGRQPTAARPATLVGSQDGPWWWQQELLTQPE